MRIKRYTVFVELCLLVAPTAYVLHTRAACARSLIETVGSQLLGIWQTEQI